MVLSTKISSRGTITLFFSLWANGCFALDDINPPSFVHEIIEKSSYTSNDDVSWAVRSTHLSSALGDKQEKYNKHIRSCLLASTSSDECHNLERLRLKMNMHQVMSVRNYTETGFRKIKAPENLFSMVKDFYDKYKGGMHSVEGITPYQNTWEAPTTIFRANNNKVEGVGLQLSSKILHATRSILEQWTGQRLSPSSSFGIQLYKNQSIVAPHVKRMPLVISAICMVDEDVNEPWPFEVYDHGGKAHNITMKPGEILLYESHSAIHGRPFALNGRLYIDAFFHFEPIGPISASIVDTGAAFDLPPYLLPKSPWEEQWRKDYPNGWNVLNDPIEAVKMGDIRALQYIAKTEPNRLVKRNEIGFYPIHLAVQFSEFEIVKSLIDIGINPRIKTKAKNGRGQTALQLAYSLLPKGDPIIHYLESATPKKSRNSRYYEAPTGVRRQIEEPDEL